MKAVFIIFQVLLLALSIKSHDEQPSDGGPVTMLIDNLASNTAQITNEIQLDLSRKFERSSADLLGNIEIITSAAMEQLGEAVFQANIKLPSCPQNWTMQELLQRIDQQLTDCTTNLQNLRTTFQSESQTLLQGLQAYVAQLSSLPAQCVGSNEAGNLSFASSTSCFVQLLAELNRNVSQLVAQANTSLVHTRQSTNAGVTTATACSTQVVEKVVKFLSDAFEKC